MTICYLLKLKNKNCPDIKKRLLRSFYFLKVKFIKNNLLSFLCYSFVETYFRMKLGTLVTKYTDTFTFNFTDTINPKWSIMPLH